MAKGIHSEASQHVRMLFEAGAVGGLTDTQLLERFQAREGEAAELAFAALVERHGPMILRVCRRTLRDEHDAQDAFQATFLVLVRRADSLHARDSLGGWLHGVACRVAACSRAAEVRRRVHERMVAEAAPNSTPAADVGWDDLGPVLHEEIGRLPETYRAAVVLCDLEGLTQDQAAQRLGWPPGTVRSRLARGRGRLQVRLTRRGLAPAVGTIASLLTAEAATAAVPAALVEAAARAATLTAAGQTIAGVVSAAALSEVVVRAMFMTRIKFIAAALLTIGAGAGGTAVIAYQQAPGQHGTPTAPGEGATEPSAPVAGLPTAAEFRSASETPPPGSPAQDEGAAEIARLETELKRAEDRFLWALRMRAKGYVSATQLVKDREDVGLKLLALERAWEKRTPQGKGLPPVGNTPEKRKRDEVGLLSKEIQRVQAEMRAAVGRAQSAVRLTTSKALQRDQSPGPLSEAEWKLVEAEVAFAIAERDLKQAELALLELRLIQAKH
jgi:RNA polymerase sigma factor (sigma-70 family)